MPVSIINYIKILYYDRIDVSEGTDANKTSASRECDICHYWFFLNFSFNQMSAIDVMIYDVYKP